ncbi:hypothetical protein FG386_002813 [Cryptosporidium ryanae]|uniref:uncharacterized protein n=1 Tax=Cryptosporidium ryanae TaxID=515981 RepID=UPI003519DE05|nr:hypothetical protein FG386_002813 [Cryptosporidium ryanae]
MKITRILILLTFSLFYLLNNEIFNEEKNLIGYNNVCSFLELEKRRSKGKKHKKSKKSERERRRRERKDKKRQKRETAAEQRKLKEQQREEKRRERLDIKNKEREEKQKQKQIEEEKKQQKKQQKELEKMQKRQRRELRKEASNYNDYIEDSDYGDDEHEGEYDSKYQGAVNRLSGRKIVTFPLNFQPNTDENSTELLGMSNYLFLDKNNE